MKLRYMIIGAGGVGGPVGAYLSKSGADTTLIARGKHLAVLQEYGLTLVSGENERESIPVKAIDMDGFLAAREQGAPAPDVIFVCVKGYSLADTVPFIRKAAGRDTVVIPVLNIYGTGRALQAELPELLVTDGCIYISANRIAPGVIQKHGAICRIVYGLPSHKTDHPVLQQVETDLKNAGIDPVYSSYVERDTLLKFAYVSPNAACGQYYHAKAAEMQHPGEVRDSFVRLIKEVVALADKMGIPLESAVAAATMNPAKSVGLYEQYGSITEGKIANVVLLDEDLNIKKIITASKLRRTNYQKYLADLAEQYGVDVPEYRKIAEAVKKQTENK